MNEGRGGVHGSGSDEVGEPLQQQKLRRLGTRVSGGAWWCGGRYVREQSLGPLR